MLSHSLKNYEIFRPTTPPLPAQSHPGNEIDPLNPTAPIESPSDSFDLPPTYSHVADNSDMRKLINFYFILCNFLANMVIYLYFL